MFDIPKPRIQYQCTDFIIKNEPVFAKYETIDQQKLKHIFLTFIPSYWKDIINNLWTPVQKEYHLCQTDHEPSCDIVNIPANVYLLPKIENDLPQFHICIPDWCFQTHTPTDELHACGKFVLNLNECHICNETGIEHFCGEFCSS